MTGDKETLSVYDRQASQYADLIETDRPYPRLEAFIAAMPPGGKVLDLGCGPGTWAARMVAAGLDVEALDASAGMAEVARARYGIEVRVARFEDVTGAALYDGVWAHFSLLHAPREAMPGHLETLAKALRPGGLLVLHMKLGEGAARDGKGRFYTYFTEPELVGLLEAAGFAIEGREIGEDVGFDGSRHDFIALSARRT